jgi:hypothetical protein
MVGDSEAGMVTDKFAVPPTSGAVASLGVTGTMVGIVVGLTAPEFTVLFDTGGVTAGVLFCVPSSGIYKLIMTN